MALEPWPLKQGSEGQRTKTAQWLMQGHNKYQIHTFKGKVDGTAEADTALAFKNTRYWLGFPLKYCVQQYGPIMQDYLLGKRPLPLDYRARRFARQLAARRTTCYPLAKQGTLIGFPGIGTHSWWAPPNNWQSDNAVDIATSYGTPVLAYKTGKIGSKVGPLLNGDPRFHGIRLYLETPDGNQFYYAHMSRVVVKPYQAVKVGQVLGYSGEANGVQHLHWACLHGNPLNLLKALSV